MPKKHSLAALLALFTGLLIFCCVESTRLFASADRQFETLADDIFRQEVSANTITIRFRILPITASAIRTSHSAPILSPPWKSAQPPKIVCLFYTPSPTRN